MVKFWVIYVFFFVSLIGGFSKVLRTLDLFIFSSFYDVSERSETFSENGSDIISMMEGHMEKIADEFGIVYYDFSSDPYFSKNPTFFFNSDHLNEHGSRIFSQRIKRVANLKSNCLYNVLENC